MRPPSLLGIPVALYLHFCCVPSRQMEEQVGGILATHVIDRIDVLRCSHQIERSGNTWSDLLSGVTFSSGNSSCSCNGRGRRWVHSRLVDRDCSSSLYGFWCQPRKQTIRRCSRGPRLAHSFLLLCLWSLSEGLRLLLVAICAS